MSREVQVRTSRSKDCRRSVRREMQQGLQYEGKCKSSKQSFHFAVSADFARDFLTMPQVLRAMAEAPGSSLRFYRSERKLSRFYKRELKQIPRKKLKAFILAMRTPAEVEAKVKELYTRPRSFLLECPSSHRVACPGRRQAA